MADNLYDYKRTVFLNDNGQNNLNEYSYEEREGFVYVIDNRLYSSNDKGACIVKVDRRSQQLVNIINLEDMEDEMDETYGSYMRIIYSAILASPDFLLHPDMNDIDLVRKQVYDTFYVEYQVVYMDNIIINNDGMTVERSFHIPDVIRKIINSEGINMPSEDDFFEQPEYFEAFIYYLAKVCDLTILYKKNYNPSPKQYNEGDIIVGIKHRQVAIFNNDELYMEELASNRDLGSQYMFNQINSTHFKEIIAITKFTREENNTNHVTIRGKRRNPTLIDTSDPSNIIDPYDHSLIAILFKRDMGRFSLQFDTTKLLILPYNNHMINTHHHIIRYTNTSYEDTFFTEIHKTHISKKSRLSFRDDQTLLMIPLTYELYNQDNMYKAFPVLTRPYHSTIHTSGGKIFNEQLTLAFVGNGSLLSILRLYDPTFLFYTARSTLSSDIKHFLKHSNALADNAPGKIHVKQIQRLHEITDRNIFTPGLLERFVDIFDKKNRAFIGFLKDYFSVAIKIITYDQLENLNRDYRLDTLYGDLSPYQQYCFAAIKELGHRLEDENIDQYVIQDDTFLNKTWTIPNENTCALRISVTLVRMPDTSAFDEVSYLVLCRNPYPYDKQEKVFLESF